MVWISPSAAAAVVVAVVTIVSGVPDVLSVNSSFIPDKIEFHFDGQLNF